MWAAIVALGVNLAEPATGPSARAVLIGPEERTVDVRASLAELLERGDAVGVDFERIEVFNPAEVTRQPGGTLVARVWLDLRPDTEVTIFIVDATGQRILIRRVPLESGLDEVGREQVAHIVATAIEVLAEGATLGVTREEARAELGVLEQPDEDASRAPPPSTTDPAPPPTPTPPLPTDPPHRLRWEVGLGYQAQAWSRPVPLQHGPLLWTELRATGRLTPGGGVSFRYQPPIPLPSGDANAQVFSPRGFALLAPRLRPRLALRVAVGGGIDAYLGRPKPTIGTAWTLIPMVELVAGVVWDVDPLVRLHLSAVVDADLVDTRFVVQSSDRVLLDPWRVRPGLRVGVALGRRPRGHGRGR